MFIYEFMAGIVDTITGGEDEESFDPHTHRKVEKPTSYSDTMIHLLKGSIGAGILAMPDAVSRMGILFSIVGLMLIGFFATYCIQLLIAAQYQLCKRWRRGYIAYPKSMRLALQDGPPCIRWAASLLYYFVDITLILWQLGICCIYFVFVAENIKQVCDFYGQVLSLRMHLCVLLGPLTILSLVKDLKLMTPLSSISNVVTIFGLILVFFYLIEEDLTLEDEKLQIKSFLDIPIFIGIALFALEAVGVVLALEYNMENPKRFVGFCGLFNIGMLVIISLYLIVGVFGYLKYGESIQASLTLNLPQEQKKAQAAKIIFALAIFLTFPLQNFVAYNIIWRKLKKKIMPSRQWFCDYVLRVMLVIIPWSLAVAVPQLGPFIALFGALCLSLLAMVFPGMMDACVWYPDRYGACRYRLVRDVFIVLIGLACLSAGCYTSLLEIAAEVFDSGEPFLYDRSSTFKLNREEFHSAGPTTGRRGARVHFRGNDQAYTLGRRRRPRALSSPSRSGCPSYSPGSRPRSPSVCRSPSAEPVCPCARAAGEGLCGFGGFAYFSPQPPPAPLWLVPLPAPRVTAVVASFNTQTSSVTSSISDKVPSKDSDCTVDITDERKQACGEPDETRKAQSDRCVTSTRSTLESDLSPCSVAVQTIMSDTEADFCGFTPTDKRTEWAGGARALRDGHVRLALRALRQLRRAERLHRALLRGPAVTQNEQ